MDTVKISERALLGRINRRLAHADRRVCKTRPLGYVDGSPYFADLGQFHEIDISRNFVVDTALDLEEIGRELGVLGEHEAVAS
jgi:hypothetical protein